jgi:hypothetical protein
MHDVLTFEDRGIPTVLLCTGPFMNSAADHAVAFGNPDYRVVRIGHPLASLRAEQAQARADEAFEQVVAALTGRAERQAASIPERHEEASP